MSTILLTSIGLIILIASCYIFWNKISHNDPDLKIQENYRDRIMTRYK